jgi:integrase
MKAGYVGKVKTCIRWRCAHNRVRYPFEYGHTLLPKDARSPLIRFSLDSAQLNKLFKECAEDADQKRPEDARLPLLAYLTGARSGELAGLQPHNIKQREGVDIVDLTTQIADEDGARNRPIKTRESLRVFTLHRCLREIGFIEWAESQRSLGHVYLFPDLHAAKRPTPANSKKFQRLFKNLGMDKRGPYVFHSLRLSFKDWARSLSVPERTITLQAGHSLDGIALKYGSRILRPDEMRQISSLPFQPGLGIEIFKHARPSSVAPPPARTISRRKACENAVAISSRKTPEEFTGASPR